jgi:hypothetical protein
MAVSLLPICVIAVPHLCAVARHLERKCSLSSAASSTSIVLFEIWREHMDSMQP